MADLNTRILRRAGYAPGQVELLLTKLNQGLTRHEPFEWGDNRALATAHEYIRDNWYRLQSGQVIDVEFILGETTKPKEPES
jgi:hypothetical protein